MSNQPLQELQTDETPGPSAPSPVKAQTSQTASTADPAAIMQSDLDVLLNAAAAEQSQDASSSSASPSDSFSPAHHPFEFGELKVAAPAIDVKRISMLGDVNLNVKIELGRTRMLVEDVLKLGEGSVVELDKLAGDPVDVYANDRLVARGEVLVLNDSFCVRINEVLSRDPHRVTQG